MRILFSCLLFTLGFAFVSYCQDWNQLGPGFVNHPGGGVRCFITSDDNELIIGFAFVEDNDGQKLARIAKWNGDSMSPMGCGFALVCDEIDNPNANFGPRDLMYFQDTLYACGRFTHSGDTELNNIAKWDGENWLPLGQGLDGAVLDMMVYNETIYIGGYFTFSGGTALNGLAQWNGEEWLPVFDFPQFSGSMNFVNTIQFFQGELYVGGNFNDGDLISDLVVYRDGIWQSPNGWFCGPMSDVTCLAIYDDELIVAGSFNEGNCANAFGNSIVSFNGETWDDLNGGLINETIPALNNQIRQLLITDEYLYCAGVVQYVSNQPTSRIARWNGNEWCSYQPPNLQGEEIHPLFALTMYDDKLVVGAGSNLVLNQDYINGLATFDDIPFGCFATDVSELSPDHPNFRIFPNPASDVISVSWDSVNLQPTHFALMTIEGKTVIQEEVSNNNHYVIDSSNLAEGLYVLLIQSVDGSFTEKIVISK